MASAFRPQATALRRSAGIPWRYVGVDRGACADRVSPHANCAPAETEENNQREII